MNMKIKKFNESIMYNDVNYLSISRKNILNESDFMKIHGSGRNVYYLNNDGEFIECKNSRKLSNLRDYNIECGYIVFMSEENIKNKSLVGMAKKIKEMSDLYKLEIENRYKILIGAADKIEKG